MSFWVWNKHAVSIWVMHSWRIKILWLLDSSESIYTANLGQILCESEKYRQQCRLTIRQKFNHIYATLIFFNSKWHRESIKALNIPVLLWSNYNKEQLITTYFSVPNSQWFSDNFPFKFPSLQVSWIIYEGDEETVSRFSCSCWVLLKRDLQEEEWGFQATLPPSPPAGNVLWPRNQRGSSTSGNYCGESTERLELQRLYRRN